MNYPIIIAVIVVVALIGFIYFGFSSQSNPVQGPVTTTVTTPYATTTLQQSAPVNLSQMYCVNAVMNTTVMQIAMSNGIRCFRTDISFNPTVISIIQNTSSQGAQWLGILDYQTVGAQPSQQGCVSGCNWTLSTWNASIENALKTYPEIHNWEIWNEPLDSIFAVGYENGSVHNYFEMIKSAYTIIKAHNPNDTVVCLGGAQVYPYNYANIEFEFTEALWNYSAGNYCDAISLHLYAGPYYNLTQIDSSGQSIGAQYEEVVAAFEKVTNKPIWITEVGIPSNNFTQGTTYFSQQNQQNFMSQTLVLLRDFPYVQKVYWFNLADTPTTTTDYGILNSSYEPKLAWSTYLGFLNGSRS